MSQSSQLRALKFCFRISRLKSLNSICVQKNILRSLSSSSERYLPFTDWFFGKKGEVPSVKAVPDSQELHGFALKDDFNWLRDPNSRVSILTLEKISLCLNGLYLLFWMEKLDHRSCRGIRLALHSSR